MSIRNFMVQYVGDTLNLPEFEREVNVIVEYPKGTRYVRETISTLGSWECEYVIEDNMNETEGMGDVWFRCTNCDMTYDYHADDWLLEQNHCPHCGARVTGRRVKR